MSADDYLLWHFGVHQMADACDVTKTEKLRAYDAVHLASALKIGADIFASADADLCRAANRQGLNIFNPGMN